MIRLCRLEDVGLGEARGFDPAGCGEDSLFIVRRPGCVTAFVNICPHQGVRLEFKKDKFLSADGSSIVCSAHGAHFDPSTGACTGGACQGQTLERLNCLERDGWLWAAVPSHSPTRA